MTLHISKKLVWSIVYGFIASSILIFSFQFGNEIHCELIPIRQVSEDYSIFDEYNLQVDNYIQEKEKILINSPKKSNGSLEEFYLGNSDIRELETLKSWNQTRNRRLQYFPIEIDSCKQQAFNNDFVTFFGDTVENDYDLKSQSETIEFLSESEISQLYKNNIVHPDQYFELENYSELIGEIQLPELKTKTKYRVFNQKFTKCDCMSVGNKLNIRTSAFLKDFEYAIIIGLIIGIGVYFIRKTKFKVRLKE